MEREIMRLLPYILIGMFVLGALLFLLALYLLRLRRKGAYWRLRRKAGDRGGKLFLLSIGLMLGSVVLALLSGLGILAYRNVNVPPTRGPGDLYGIILTPTASDYLYGIILTPTVADPAETATPETTAALSPSPLPATTLAPANTPTATATSTATPIPLLTNTPAPTATLAVSPNLEG